MRRDIRTSIRIFGPIECLRAYFVVRYKSHRKLESQLGVPSSLSQSMAESPPIAAVARCKAVKRYIENITRISGDRFTCLMASLAAKRLLERKGVRCDLCIGVSLESKGVEQPRSFEAHSWLTCGSFVVVGDAELEKFKLIKKYK